MGHPEASNAQVAWLAGYSPSSTSYTNPRSALHTAGLIVYPRSGVIALSEAGIAMASAPAAIAGTILDRVLDQLRGPERAILAAVAHHWPKAVTNEVAATMAGYTPTSTSYTNPRSALRTKSLISYPTSGQLRAEDWLFP
jgi:hypothetical protein